MIASTKLDPPEGVPLDVWERIARQDGNCWVTDERDSDGTVVGSSVRYPPGSEPRFRSRGSRGLTYVPLDNYDGSSEAKPIFVCEGASDVAALMSIGLVAVGTPGAGKCGDMLAVLLKDRHAVVVRDGDRAGTTGAKKIAEDLVPFCASVRIIAPPFGGNDAREDISEHGSLAADFLDLVKITKPEEKPKYKSTGSALLLNLGDVEPTTVEWLWPGRIPLGKITMVAGDGGCGKSTLMLDVAARVTSGLPWPDKSGFANQGSVLILSCEDDPSDSISPRMRAHGADCSRVNLMQATVSNSGDGRIPTLMDVDAIAEAIDNTPDCKLVIIDPVSAYVDAGRDDHKNSDVRQLLAPIAELAADRGVAVVAIHHLAKGNSKALYRIMGSVAWAAAARAAWGVAIDPDDDAELESDRRRLLVPMKMNCGKPAEPWAYTIQECNRYGVGVLDWESEASEVTDSNQVFAGDKSHSKRESPAIAEAMSFLGTELAGKDHLPAKTVRDLTEDAGLSWATVRRAAKKMGVEISKSGFDGGWVWSLPGAMLLGTPD